MGSLFRGRPIKIGGNLGIGPAGSPLNAIAEYVDTNESHIVFGTGGKPLNPYFNVTAGVCADEDPVFASVMTSFRQTVIDSLGKWVDVQSIVYLDALEPAQLANVTGLTILTVMDYSYSAIGGDHVPPPLDVTDFSRYNDALAVPDTPSVDEKKSASFINLHTPPTRDPPLVNTATVETDEETFLNGIITDVVPSHQNTYGFNISRGPAPSLSFVRLFFGFV